MEERHEKALIRKKAFVECVKKVKKYVSVFYFNLSFSVFNILVTPHARAVSHILSQLTTPLAPRLLHLISSHLFVFGIYI